MKHSRPPRRCCCCCCSWVTVLLVASSVINVSPETSSVALRFEVPQQPQQSMHITTSSTTTTMGYNNNNDDGEDFTAITAAARTRIESPTKTSSAVLESQAATIKANQIQSISREWSNWSNWSNRSIEQQQHLLRQQPPYHQHQLQFLPSSMFFQQTDVAHFDPSASVRLRQRRAEKQPEKCLKFIEGEPGRNELYSPDYPNDYPKNINCTRVIVAPKGQIIRLDFRNSFYIEAKEDCKFDFLEIRDGQYGFSNLIGKYCGTDFPPEITSKERYLWLFFHSDESIEYSGFTAVYEFIDRSREAPSSDLNCTIEKGGYEGWVNSSDITNDTKKMFAENNVPLDCMWRIQVLDKWKIQVKFMEFKLSKPNDCEINFLDIFPEQTTMPARIKNFCGSAGEGLSTNSNIIHMRFYAEQMAVGSTFSILYTAFRDKTNTGCKEDEYDCEDATCISKGLMCNDRDNCKFRWDELDERCHKESSGQSEHVIIIIVVFGLLLGGMVVTFFVNCIRKIMRDQKIIREHIRQSKESELNEMGRNSKARSRDNLSIAMSPRQKHSQTSLQMLDDVYYREVVPIAVQPSKSDLKAKEHSILRQHHDIYVQTSLVRDDSSSTATPSAAEALPAVGNVCDMGCQTRESLFLLRQKSSSASSSTASAAVVGSVPPPPRFSTFGYDMQQPPPPPPPAVSTLMRRSMRLPHSNSGDVETRHDCQPATHTHRQASGSHATPAPARPPHEVCHHHHQHQQHLQQQQRLHQQQQQQIQQQYPVAAEAHNQRVPPPTQPQPHAHQHSQKLHQSTATIVPMTTAPPSGKVKHESKAFIDIRNSAPDVIIMTSH